MSAQPSYESQLTRAEAQYHAQVSEYDSKGNLTRAAAAIAAAFLGYRWYMQRKLKEELKATDSSATVFQTIMDVYESYQNIWIKTVLPHLVSGYADGLIDVHRGNIPSNVLLEIAEGYAENLGKHINEVSAEAMAKGFQAQLNRKVPPARALQRVLEAFGVPPRTMNTLVNVWSQEEPKITSSVVPLDHKRARASLLIQDGISVRGKLIGENETWSVREQAKQIVWMYGVQTGTIPETATRRWITAEDERVCPTCGPMHERQVSVTEEFQIPGFGKVWAPPLHPNCRCDIAIDMDIIAPIRELATVRKSLVAKSQRKVETPEGAKWFGQPIGSRITGKQKTGQQATARAPESQQQSQTRSQGMTYDAFRSLPADERLGLVEHLLNTKQDMTEADLRALSVEVDYAVSEIQEAAAAQEAANAPAKETEKVKLSEPREAKVRLSEPKEEKVRLSEPVEAKVRLSEPGVTTLKETKEEKATEGEKVFLEETDQAKKPKSVNPEIMRLEKPMFTYIDPGQVKAEKNLLGKKVAVTSDQNRWQASTGYGQMGEVLSNRVSLHWDGVINDQLMHLFDNEATGDDVILMDYRDADEDAPSGYEEDYVYIDRRTFVQVFKNFLSGHGEPSDTIPVPLQFSDGHTVTAEIFVDRIGSYFNFHDFIVDNMPYLAMADYVDSSRQDYRPDVSGKSASITGRWVVEEDYDTYQMGKDGYIGGVPGVSLPHRAVFLRPEYMDD